MTNDLLTLAGYSDVRELRDRFGLHDILKEYNCNLGDITTIKLLRLMKLNLMGHTFVIKTHEKPAHLLMRLWAGIGWLKATYIYRDPRDVALSAFEHGERIRREGGSHTFARLRSMEEAIRYAGELVSTWSEWLKLNKAVPDKVLIVRYEDLNNDTLNELRRLIDFLGLNISADQLELVTGKYSKTSRSAEKKGLHFNVGETGRYKSMMNEAELSLCDEIFGKYLRAMGYDR